MASHADTAGNVRLSVRHGIPDIIHRIQISFSVGIALRKQRRYVGNARIEITCAHCMSHAVCLFLDRRKILGIIASPVSAFSQAGILSSTVDQDFCGINVLLTSAFAFIFFYKFRQLDQCQLNLLVSRNLMAASVRPEQRYNLIRETFSDNIEAVIRVADPFSVAGVRHYRLKEMACIVHLMV